ncbi:hypothetical protein GCM10011494_19010 [Novosphingobium endophyticum]|uniref:DUF4387 domain-containing protein n=1 Tax=Novosphingobium endophyticum TaxID=1955250 RepID=A0A916X5H9_9SPHN|nr:DUF4387 family protein [Novosphingobium endophyticum]GGC00648.1 hypothetical protein GCM10011494_19010 [Novosphingobium endophyticum]
MPIRLGDLAPGLKCRNAGASWLTFDIPFSTLEDLELVIRSGAINERMIAEIYGVPFEHVSIYVYKPAVAIKVTLPRASAAGGVDESDFDGAQQFAPLLDVEIA